MSGCRRALQASSPPPTVFQHELSVAMQFPSIVNLAARGWEVVLRLPWTMSAGVVAAIAAIIATTESGDTPWVRVAMVAALGLPLSLALTLLAEERGWTAGR